ncbi:MAG: hypothetical protein AVDCRST_MAG54-4970, partial [uncultured Actinomycetospora sp.]
GTRRLVGGGHRGGRGRGRVRHLPAQHVGLP